MDGERRKIHECIQENFLGQVKEFMESQKGTKVLQWSIVGIIIIQVGAFLVMWGSLTNTVKTHEKSFDRVWAKLDGIKIVGYVEAAEEKK